MAFVWLFLKYFLRYKTFPPRVFCAPEIPSPTEEVEGERFVISSEIDEIEEKFTERKLHDCPERPVLSQRFESDRNIQQVIPDYSQNLDQKNRISKVVYSFWYA